VTAPVSVLIEVSQFDIRVWAFQVLA